MKRVWLLSLIALVVRVQAQDTDWVRMWTEAQQRRPAAIGSVGRIAPPNEPGTPMIIHGRVFQRDGKTPIAGAIVFAYHTDHKGVYNVNEAPGWRLRGWAKSDASGRFEFRTIRPAPYPGRRIPAHLHLTIEGPRIARRGTDEVRFLDDPFVTAAEKQRSVAAGAFGWVRPVTTKAGVQHVDLNVRLSEEGRF
ncbi:MAG TPA: hypothetical protein VKB93_01290 [Thermoanaerobaculia bacterium]|nr:hypothetical protein [Thermoanaerobaculia bacterium]